VIRDLTINKDLKSTINGQLKQHGNKFQNIPEKQRIVFEIRDDNDFLEKYVIPDNNTSYFDALKKEAKDKNNSRSVRSMASALLSIHQWWKSILTDDCGGYDELFQEEIQSFYMYLSHKVLVLYLATPNNLDDAYNLFTILNSRGLKLQPSDILKAQNLRIIKDETLRKKYAEEWSSYENIFDTPYSDFDSFLFALIDIKMKYSSDGNMSIAIAFENMAKNNILAKGEPLFMLIKKYINHYEKLLNWSSDTENNLFLSNIVTILCTTAPSRFMSLLMHYRECFGDYRITEFIIKLDNLLSVMWILGKRDSNTRNFIILRKMDELLAEFSKEANGKVKAADVFLSSNILKYDYVDEKANTSMNINEFFETIDSELWGSFSGSRVNKVKYLLLKLDLIYGNKNTKITYNSSTASLEHILPRTITKTEWDVSTTDHEKWCHRLGNLVLLDRRKNTAISNSVYSIKKQKYSDSIESRAHTNKLFMNYNSWGVNDLIKNHNNIIELLKKYYLGNSLETLNNLQK
jgi:hypothetical protein